MIRPSYIRFMALATFTTLLHAIAASASAQPPSTRDLLAREISAAKAAGYPVTSEDLEQKIPPGEQNAFQVYLKWHEMLTATRVITPEDETVLGLAAKSNATSQQIDAARAIVQNKHEAFDLIHSASRYPHCVFSRDYSRGSFTLYPELGEIRRMARALLGESAVILHDGNPALAARTASIGFSISAHCTQSPGLIAAGVASAIDEMTLGELEIILFSHPENAAARTAVVDALNDRGKAQRPSAALRSQIAEALADAELLRLPESQQDRMVGSHDGNILDVLNSLNDTSGVTQVDLNDEVKPSVIPIINIMPPRSARSVYSDWINSVALTSVRFLRQILDASALTFDERMAAASGATSAISTMIVQEIQRGGKAGPSATPIAALRCEEVYNYLRLRRDDYDDARADLLRATAAIFEYRFDRGFFPKQLEDAVPKPPVDPFDGKPIKYRQDDAGFTLYSVGRNHRFDGGRPERPIDRSEAVIRYSGNASALPGGQ